jgi:hypothetical protein
MSQQRREIVVPATTLDPYTRLLASLADVASRARESLPTSFGGRLLMWGLVWMVGAWSLLALLLWSPLIIALGISYAFYRAAAWSGIWLQALFNAAVGRLAEWKLGIGAARREARVVKSVRKAASDDGFMRSVLGSLPGVDAERVMQRIDSLGKFSVTDGEGQDGGEGMRRRRRGVETTGRSGQVFDEQEGVDVMRDDANDAHIAEKKARKCDGDVGDDDDDDDGDGDKEEDVIQGGCREKTGNVGARGTQRKKGGDSELEAKQGRVREGRAATRVEDFEIEEVEEEERGGGVAHERLGKKTGGDLLLELVRKGYMVMMSGQEAERI